jgi:predicted nucleic acid-binding protein
MEKQQNNTIIADTSGLISLVVDTDHNYTIAQQVADKFMKEPTEIVVITAVYVEFLNVLGRSFSHERAVALASVLFTYPFVLLNEPQDIPASGALEKFTSLPQGVSLTDCLVMATADAYFTKDIFGFDKQFADAGYTRLTPSTEW